MSSSFNSEAKAVEAQDMKILCRRRRRSWTVRCDVAVTSTCSNHLQALPFTMTTVTRPNLHSLTKEHRSDFSIDFRVEIER